MNSQELPQAQIAPSEALPALPISRGVRARALLGGAAAMMALLPAACTYDSPGYQDTDIETSTPGTDPQETTPTTTVDIGASNIGESEEGVEPVLEVVLSRYEESCDAPFGTKDSTDISKQLVAFQEAMSSIYLSNNTDGEPSLDCLKAITNPELNAAVNSYILAYIQDQIDNEHTSSYRISGRQNKLALLLLQTNPTDTGQWEDMFQMYDFAHASEIRNGIGEIREWIDDGYGYGIMDQGELRMALGLFTDAVERGDTGFTGDANTANETAARVVNNTNFLSAGYEIITSLEIGSMPSSYYTDLELINPNADEQNLVNRFAEIVAQIQAGDLTQEQKEAIKSELENIMLFIIGGTEQDADVLLMSLARPSIEEIVAFEDTAYSNFRDVKTSLVAKQVDGNAIEQRDTIPDSTEVPFTGVKGVEVFDVSLQYELEYFETDNLEFHGEPVADLFAEIRVVDGKLQVIYPDGAIVPDVVKKSIEQAAIEAAPFLTTAFEAGNLNVVRFIMPRVNDAIKSRVPDYYDGSTMRNGVYYPSLNLIDIEIYGNGSLSQGILNGVLRHEGTHAAFADFFSSEHPITEQTFNELKKVCAAITESYATGLEQTMDSMIPQLEVLKDAVDPKYRYQFTQFITELQENTLSESIQADTDEIQDPYNPVSSTASGVICSRATLFEALMASAPEDFDVFAFQDAYFDLSNPDKSSPEVVEALKKVEDAWFGFIEDYSLYTTFKESTFIVGTDEDTELFGHPFDNANEATASLINALSEDPVQFAERVKSLDTPQDRLAVVELVRFIVDRAREISPELSGLDVLEAEFLAALYS